MVFGKYIKNRNKRRRFSHIGAAIVILIHSYDNYESGQKSYIFFCIAGLVFLAIALIHAIIEKKAPWVDGVFFIIEGMLSIIAAIDSFELGKKALPVAYLLLAAFQFFVALRKSKKGIERHKLVNKI